MRNWTLRIKFTDWIFTLSIWLEVERTENWFFLPTFNPIFDRKSFLVFSFCKILSANALYDILRTFFTPDTNSMWSSKRNQLTSLRGCFGRWGTFLSDPALTWVWRPPKVVPCDRYRGRYGLVFPRWACYILSGGWISQKLPLGREKWAGWRRILALNWRGYDVLISTDGPVTICRRTRTSVVKEVCRHHEGSTVVFSWSYLLLGRSWMKPGSVTLS